MRHLLEQHWLFVVHVAFLGRQQFGSLGYVQPGPQQASLRPHAGQVNTHPVAGLQVSAVQLTPSLQVMAVKTQPVAGLQLSVVQALLSLPLGATYHGPAARVG